MSENKNESAFAFRSTAYSDSESNNYGLTKREYIAAMAMQGILANELWNQYEDGVNWAARTAVSAADELLKQLDT